MIPDETYDWEKCFALLDEFRKMQTQDFSVPEVPRKESQDEEK